MCGRYSSEKEFSQIRLVFEADDQTFRPFVPKYNISPSAGPGYEQLIVTAGVGESRQLRLARFWLIPASWSKPLSQLPTTFNARSEDLGRRKLWREPYAQARCLVPATGWREFSGPSSPKQPYHFRPLPKDESESPAAFAFAGISARWTSPAGEVVDSFAILTTEPSEAAGRIHDRMPLVLPSHLHEAWLVRDAERDEVLALGQRYSAELALDIFPSDPVANDSRYEGPLATKRVPPRQLSLLDALPKDRRSS